MALERCENDPAFLWRVSVMEQVAGHGRRMRPVDSPAHQGVTLIRTLIFQWRRP
jgi:hypothetical protein